MAASSDEIGGADIFSGSIFFLAFRSRSPNTHCARANKLACLAESRSAVRPRRAMAGDALDLLIYEKYIGTIQRHLTIDDESGQPKLAGYVRVAKVVLGRSLTLGWVV